MSSFHYLIVERRYNNADRSYTILGLPGYVHSQQQIKINLDNFIYKGDYVISLTACCDQHLEIRWDGQHHPQSDQPCREDKWFVLMKFALISNWHLTRRQTALPTKTSRVKNTTCVETCGLICTAPKCFTVVFENSMATCFAYAIVVLRQPAVPSKEMYLYVGADWQSLSVSQRVEEVRCSC